jgi:hypothetical protein
MGMTVVVLFTGAEFKPLAFRDGKSWQKVKILQQKWQQPQGSRQLHHFVVTTDEGQIWELVYLWPDGYWKGWCLP